MAYKNDTGFPSVTTILDQYIHSEWFTEESRDRGSAVHEACFAHLAGSYVIPLRPAWNGYFDSFRRWCDNVKPQAVIAEERLVDDAIGFCGQPDFVGHCGIRAGCGLIDWKTSLAIEKWFRLQGAAYRHLSELRGVDTVWGGNLRLKADGSSPLFDYWPDGYAIDLNRFLCAFNLYRYFD